MSKKNNDPNQVPEETKEETPEEVTEASQEKQEPSQEEALQQALREQEDKYLRLLAEYDNPDSMANALKRMMEEPELLARCRANALKAVDDRFEVHKMAEATFRIYEKAAKG